MSKYNTVEFVTQVVNQYLYGQDSKPSDTDLLAGKYLSQPAQKTIDVDAPQYMQDVGRYITVNHPGFIGECFI